ncbi:MAG: phosphoglucosamine mutase [Gammaproteobacteria bacterium]|nr:phosphoglucosamine mutase [Gammaproteobacteria bacterium]
MKRKFFGTDGIRGRVGDGVMTPEFVLKLGWAAGKVLCEEGNNLILIGKDTRISGYMLESVLEAGLSAAGVNSRLLGPMPTPAIAYLTRTLRASAGIVISASHNPYYDNGVKFFSSEGTKLPDDIEQRIEEEMEKPLTTVSSDQLGKVERIRDASGRYIEFCKSTINAKVRLNDLKLVIDCAHGATYHVAPNVFRELGAEVVTIGAEPNGLNINHMCGATDPKKLRMAVIEHHADLGIAIDGDGDRLIMVDENGEVVDGDELLYVIGAARKRKNYMKGGVVGTLMSNLGLEHALQRQNIEFLRAAVGDRYVLEMLQQQAWELGGESSGHIICLDRTSTGDAIVAALQVLEVLVDEGINLREAKHGMSKYPQTLVNVPIRQKIDISKSKGIREAVSDAESQLADTGRVLLRPSGTEPLIRVMVEGVDAPQVRTLAEQIASAVSDECAA